MPFATTPHRRARRRCRPPDRRPGRRLAGPGRPPCWSAGPTPRSTRRRDRCRMAIINSRLRLADDPADHDPALAGRPAQARHPLRPGHRGRGARGRPASVPPASLDGRPCSSASSPSPAACGPCPACCRWCWRPPSGASAGSSCPSRRPARRPWSRAWRCSGCARWPRWSPSCAASRCPTRRRSPRCPGSRLLVLARRGAARRGRPGRPARHGTTRATPSRSPPPAATTCCCPGPKGVGQDQLAERIPGDPARPHPRGVARADRGPLAGRCPRARRRADHPAAVLRAPPRRQQGQPGRRRHRSGAARRDQPGALRGAAPRRVPAASAPT